VGQGGTRESRGESLGETMSESDVAVNTLALQIHDWWQSGKPGPYRPPNVSEEMWLAAWTLALFRDEELVKQ